MRIIVFLSAFSLSVLSFSQEVAIDVIKSKILYQGLDNYLHIVANKYECNDLKIEAENALVKKEINKSNECIYLIRPRSHGKIEIRIYSYINKKKTLLKKEMIRCMKFPPPQAYVISPRNKIISKIALKMYGRISVEYYYLDVCGEFIPKKYKYKFISRGRIISEGKINSKYFSDEFYNKLNLLKDYDEILFYDIELVLPSNITTTIIDPLKVVLCDGNELTFSSSAFYPEIDQYYWGDSLSDKQIQYWENDTIKTKYFDITNIVKKRVDFDTSGNVIRECIVKQKLERDTISSFNPETYEEIKTFNSGYIDILNGSFTEYFPYQSEKIIRIRGQYNDNLKIGIWKACKEVSPGKYECYQAEFKDDVMVGEVKKL